MKFIYKSLTINYHFPKHILLLARKNIQKVKLLIYSCLPIKQTGSNKQAGWIISETLTNKQAVINKQGGILVSIQ